MLILSLTTSALASILYVDESGDPGTYGSISEALLDAADGDEIAVAAGYWYDCVDTAGLDVTIVGTDGSGATTIDAAGTCATVITVDNGESAVSIRGFTLANRNEGGVLVGSGTVTMDDIAFTNMGISSRIDYAIEVDGATLNLSNATIDSTVTRYSGSFSYVKFDEATVRLDGVQFEGGDCSALSSSVSVIDSTFADAGFYADGDAALTIERSTFADGSKYVVWADDTSTIDVIDSTISNVSSSSGAIHAEDYVVVTVSGSTFTDNVADFCSTRADGGAINAQYGT